jgi:hypothetical protein
MVRDEVYRRKKYTGKVDADATRLRIVALKDSMTEQTDSQFGKLATLETDIKGWIEPLEVPTIMVPQYLNVGRQLWKLKNKFSGTTLDTEGLIIAQKWVARGLSASIVNVILAAMGFSQIPPGHHFYGYSPKSKL